MPVLRNDVTTQKRAVYFAGNVPPTDYYRPLRRVNQTVLICYDVLTFPHLREGLVGIPRGPKKIAIEVDFELKFPPGHEQGGMGQFLLGFAQPGIAGNSHALYFGNYRFSPFYSKGAPPRKVATVTICPAWFPAVSSGGIPRHFANF